jgi:Plasmid maintenance system killer protein
MTKLLFKHKALELLYRDQDYHHKKMPSNIQRGYVKKCRILEYMESVQDLRKMKGLHYEKYEDHHSIKINEQRRIEFEIDGIGNVIIVKILDANNHYKKNF